MLSKGMIEGYGKFLTYHDSNFISFITEIHKKLHSRTRKSLVLNESLQNNSLINELILSTPIGLDDSNKITKCFLSVIKKLKHSLYFKNIVDSLYNRIQLEKKQVIKTSTGNIIIENGIRQDFSKAGRIKKIQNFIYNKIGIKI